MVALYGRRADAAAGGRARRHAVAVRRRAADDAGRRRRARRAHAGVPHRHRPALHRPGRPGARHRRLRVSRCRHRLALAVGLPQSRAARVRGRGRPRLAALLLRPDRHLRPRPHPVHAQPGRGPLPLRPPQDRRQLDPRPGLDHPRPPHRLRRGLGRRRMHALVRGRRPAVDGVRRGPAPDPADRGQGRRQRDPAQGPRGQPRLLPHAAHALLPHQCRPPGAGRGQPLSGADRACGLGRRTPRATAPRASATAPCRRRRRRSTSRSGSTGWRRTATGACRWRWSTTASTAAAAWASWSRPARASSPASSSGRTTRPASTRWASSPRPTTSSASRSREERGEAIWLEHGEERSYTTRMAVLDGARRDRRRRSSASAPSPSSRTRDYPEPTGRWDALG